MLKEHSQTRNTEKEKTKNKPKTIKKMVIESYISIITLNGLNVSAKKTWTDWVDKNMCMY